MIKRIFSSVWIYYIFTLVTAFIVVYDTGYREHRATLTTELGLLFTAFGLISLFKPKFKPYFIGLVTIIVAMDTFTPLRELMITPIVDFFIQLMFNTELSNPNRKSFGFFIISAILLLAMCFIRKRNSFYQLFSAIMLCGCMTAMTFFHYLTIQRTFDQDVFDRNKQVSTLYEDFRDLDVFCTSRSMTCQRGLHKDMNLNEFPKVKLYLDAIYNETKDMNKVIHSWPVVDELDSFYLLTYVKKGDEVFIGIDQESNEWRFDNNCEIFNLLMGMFSLIWFTGGSYLIYRHENNFIKKHSLD